MNNINYSFFEEFKRLDKLCGELYGSQHGVSHYIDDMKCASANACFCIPGWNTDLKQLIQVRHLRNRLAHAENAFDTEICSSKDVEWIQNFHKRILTQSDPLALLHQSSTAKQQTGKKPIPSFQSLSSFPAPQLHTENKNQNFLWAVIIAVIFGVLLLAAFGILALAALLLYQ